MKKIVLIITSLVSACCGLFLFNNFVVLYKNKFISFEINTSIFFHVVSIILPMVFFLVAIILILRVFNKVKNTSFILIMILICYFFYSLLLHYYNCYFILSDLIGYKILLKFILNNKLIGVLYITCIIMLQFENTKDINSLYTKATSCIFFLSSLYWSLLIGWSVFYEDKADFNIGILSACVLIFIVGALALLITLRKKWNLKYYIFLLVGFLINISAMSLIPNKHIEPMLLIIWDKLMHSWFLSLSYSAFYVLAFMLLLSSINKRTLDVKAINTRANTRG